MRESGSTVIPGKGNTTVADFNRTAVDKYGGPSEVYRVNVKMLTPTRVFEPLQQEPSRAPLLPRGGLLNVRNEFGYER